MARKTLNDILTQQKKEWAEAEQKRSKQMLYKDALQMAVITTHSLLLRSRKQQDGTFKRSQVEKAAPIALQACKALYPTDPATNCVQLQDLIYELQNLPGFRED